MTSTPFITTRQPITDAARRLVRTVAADMGFDSPATGTLTDDQADAILALALDAARDNDETLADTVPSVIEGIMEGDIDFTF